MPIAQISEFGTFEAILGCVSAGMGISLVPRAVIPAQLSGSTPERASLRLHPLPTEVARAETLLIWHRARSPQAARLTFAECLRESLGEA